MGYRLLSRTAWKVSEVSFGARAIGGSWGRVADEEALAALHKAVECGVNFFDCQTEKKLQARDHRRDESRKAVASTNCCRIFGG